MNQSIFLSLVRLCPLVALVCFAGACTDPPLPGSFVDLMRGPTKFFSVTNPTLANVTATTVTLGGTVEYYGSTINHIRERGVRYARRIDNPDLWGSSFREATTGGSTGVFTVGITGLEPGTEYVFLPYAKDVTSHSYGPVGSFTTLPPPPPAAVGSVVQTIAVQPDGMHLIGGDFSQIGGAPHGNLARFRADGTVDASFTTNVAGGQVNSIAVQPDGKIVIGGQFTTVNGTARNRIARLLANGSLDTSFNPGTGPDGGVLSLGLQADGKIVVGGGFKMMAGTPRNFLARLTATGAHDLTFNSGTGLDTDLLNNHAVRALAVQADGKIVIAGKFTTFNGTMRNNIARLTSTGSLDTTFDPGTGADNSLNCVGLQADGKILIGGFFTTFDGTPRNSVARLTATGALDTSFDSDAAGVESITVQADGKILVGGYFDTVAGTPRHRVARLNANGSLDATVDPGISLDFFWTYSVALGMDGKILMGGLDEGLQPGDTLTARYNNNVAAVENLFATSTTRVQWSRGGSAPEVSAVTFEVSTNGGTTWTALGAGTPIAGGWERTGLALPASGSLRARGLTSDGKSSGLVEKIATFPSPPVIIDPTSTDLFGNIARLGGNITHTGGFALSERGVVFSPTVYNHNPLIGGIGVTKVASGTSSGVFTTVVNGLSPGTAYTYRAYATNAGGTSYTVWGYFTLPRAPTVTTTPAPSVGGNTAYLGGKVEDDGGSAVTSRGVVIAATGGTDPLGTKNTWSKLSTGGGTGSFGVPATGLISGTRYVYAAFATNSVGTSYGEAMTFTTTGTAPSEPEPEPSGGSFSATGSGPEELGGLPAGTHDDTFNAQLSANGTVQAIAVQPDGKILIAGDFTSVGAAIRLRLARIGANGAVDSSFTTEVNGLVSCIAVQGDGKILLGGLFNEVNGATRNGIVRLNANGSVESEVTFNPGAGADNGIYSLAVQPDGKIVIGGLFTTVQGTTRNYIARLQANGALDTTFNPISGANDAVYSVAVQPDGKILLGGHFTTFNGTARNRIARLLATGSLDSSFNPATGADARVAGVAMQTDGKILITGYFTTFNGSSRNRIARLLTTGALDTSFNPGTGANDHVYSLAVQTDGKVLIGGRFQTVNSTARNRIARLLASGAVDTTFDPGTGADAEIHAVALQEDGSILLGGLFTFVDSDPRQGFARLANDPATQTFTVVDGTQLTWMRAGAGPEILPADFEVSVDGGTTWTDLGTPGRIAGGWSLAGQRLPLAGQIRSIGKTTGGFLGGSSGVVGDTVAYNHNGIVAGLKAQLATSKKKETTLKKQIKAAKKKRKATLVRSLNQKLKAATGQTRTITTKLQKYP